MCAAVIGCVVYCAVPILRRVTTAVRVLFGCTAVLVELGSPKWVSDDPARKDALQAKDLRWVGATPHRACCLQAAALKHCAENPNYTLFPTSHTRANACASNQIRLSKLRRALTAALRGSHQYSDDWARGGCCWNAAVKVWIFPHEA